MNTPKLKTQSIIILAVVFAAFVVIAFAVPFVRNGLFWLSFIFGLIALAAQLFAFPVAFKNGETVRSKFYGFPIARIAIVYLCAQIVLSIVFMAVSKFVPAWVGLIIFVLLLAAGAIGFVAADAMRDEVERQDEKLKKDVSVMRALQSKVNALVGQCSTPAGQQAVKKLSEELQYSDPVSSNAVAEAESELSACVDTLQQAVVDGDETAILELARKASLALAERNRMCKLNKQS